MIAQRSTRRGESKSVPVTNEKRVAHDILQCTDVAAERGLSDAESPRRLGDVECLGGGDKRAKVAQFHAIVK